MSPDLLSQYIRAFTSLHRNNHPRLGPAPHKPLLLLAILDGINHGWINQKYIELSPELVASFGLLCRTLVPERTADIRIIYPFRHLVHEKFWELLKDGHVVAASELGHPTSIGQFKTLVDAGRFVPELWEVLQDATARRILRATLVDTYFPGRQAEQITAELPADLLSAEVERLIGEGAQVRFRRRPVPKTELDSDLAYLRHSLFPRVVNGIYGHTCVVCRLSIRDESGRTLVDAAHIRAFAIFGDDTPQNGLALCPNHHRGFDAGWFSVDAKHRVLTSPTVEGIENLVKNGTELLPPLKPSLGPAPEALAWHRERHGFTV